MTTMRVILIAYDDIVCILAQVFSSKCGYFRRRKSYDSGMSAHYNDLSANFGLDSSHLFVH